MILKTMLSVLALGLAAQAAEAQVSGGLRPGRDPIFEPGHPGGGGPFRPGHGGGYRPAPVTESVRMTIGRQYSGFTRLNLSQLLSVAVQGREVQDLTVTMSAQGGRSHAILMENGQAIGQPVIVPNYTIDADFTVQNPNSRTLLELNLNGPVYISEITARVLDVGGGHGGGGGWPGGGHGGPLELSEFVGQNFRGQDFLNLDAVLGLSQYQGMTISKVIIRGSSRAGRGTAELMINGFGQRSMVTLGTGLREHSLRVPGRSRIGIEINSLDLEMNGNIFIESVTVELE